MPLQENLSPLSAPLHQVIPAPQGYDGYTLDGFAVTGFCGVVNNELKNLLKTELFYNPKHVDFENVENCIIQPQVMLRFMRGVDSTDVLLSSPCYSFTVFYAGNVKSFNAKPAAEILDAFITPLLKAKVDFVSPALLNQLLPIGVVQNEAQKEKVSQKNAPIKAWDKKEEIKNQPKTGWGNVNLKINK